MYDNSINVTFVMMIPLLLNDDHDDHDDHDKHDAAAEDDHDASIMTSKSMIHKMRLRLTMFKWER